MIFRIHYNTLFQKTSSFPKFSVKTTIYGDWVKKKWNYKTTLSQKDVTISCGYISLSKTCLEGYVLLYKRKILKYGY